ncbi:MAG: hypothetical protein IT449_11850 [Phycisphaerales bacterium]|nr:hypothetical protein [Phycisphaerales bacterium]
MNYYEIWCNLKDSHKDLEFAEAVQAYLGELKKRGLIEDYSLTRRKLGFGPPELGEFNISIACKDLVQLEHAFEVIARRGGDIEGLHANVYARVTDFRSALYRSFPDPQRTGNP